MYPASLSVFLSNISSPLEVPPSHTQPLCVPSWLQQQELFTHKLLNLTKQEQVSWA